MLNTYFKRKKICETYYSGAAGPYLDEFTERLEKRGYARDKIRRFLLGADEFANWAQADYGSLTTLPADVLNCFRNYLMKLGRLLTPKGQNTVYWLGASRFVEFLRFKQLLTSEILNETLQPQLLVEFEQWMQVHRGVTSSTLANYRRHVMDLLLKYGDHVEQITAEDLQTFILRFARNNNAGLVRAKINAIRMMLRFLSATRRCTPGLEAALPKIATWPLSTLPRSLSPGDVDRVIASYDDSTAINIRDKAIILLLARLGLRASDVANLQLDDVNWSQATFTVVGKSRRESRLPLPQDVGDALLNYLNKARPLVDNNFVFITAVAPWGPITRYVVKNAAARAIRRAGIQAPSFGSHVFRRSAATNLLRQGASLQVIGEVLRHRSIDTTAIYAKVDIKLLQLVTMPWPGGTSC